MHYKIANEIEAMVWGCATNRELNRGDGLTVNRRRSYSNCNSNCDVATVMSVACHGFLSARRGWGCRGGRVWVRHGIGLGNHC